MNVNCLKKCYDPRNLKISYKNVFFSFFLYFDLIVREEEEGDLTF